VGPLKFSLSRQPRADVKRYNLPKSCIIETPGSAQCAISYVDAFYTESNASCRTQRASDLTPGVGWLGRIVIRNPRGTQPWELLIEKLTNLMCHEKRTLSVRGYPNFPKTNHYTALHTNSVSCQLFRWTIKYFHKSPENPWEWAHCEELKRVAGLSERGWSRNSEVLLEIGGLVLAPHVSWW
jgi:hypothetical protein